MTPDLATDHGRYRLGRALTPAQCQAVAAALIGGTRARDLAEAYSVNVRTIYRAAKYGRSRWQRVEVLGWAAEYVVTEYGPVRCTAWMPA